jgi:hypothetical protein
MSHSAQAVAAVERLSFRAARVARQEDRPQSRLYQHVGSASRRVGLIMGIGF